MKATARALAGLGAGLALLLPAAAAPLRVLTTTPPLQSLAADIAGPHGQVENWLAGGGDPHDFQFPARDLRRLREADVLIVNGLGLETWLQRAIERAGKPAGLRVIEAAAGIPESQLILGECPGHDHDHHAHAHGHDHAHAPNPHVWLDPVLARHLVTNIARALVAADPAHAGAYEASAAALSARLEALHGDFALRLAPVQRQAFIVFHDAFPYLVRRYALRQAGVVEEAASVEPSARHLTALGATVRAEGVRVMFLEPGARSRLAQRLARDWRLQLATLDPLETAAESGPGAYEAAMRRNLDALVAALQPAAL
ncbi:MAG TPA: zinc ABC transporter substrate-binding protein [Verrucomicrobiota bacterium]|nr:zinc ABC transporter substrate-binding protein [Verrucomicrobiota bacterium]